MIIIEQKMPEMSTGDTFLTWDTEIIGDTAKITAQVLKPVAPKVREDVWFGVMRDGCEPLFVDIHVANDAWYSVHDIQLGTRQESECWDHSGLVYGGAGDTLTFSVESVQVAAIPLPFSGVGLALALFAFFAVKRLRKWA